MAKGIRRSVAYGVDDEYVRIISSGWCTSPWSLSSHRPGASDPGTRVSYGNTTTSMFAALHAAS